MLQGLRGLRVPIGLLGVLVAGCRLPLSAFPGAPPVEAARQVAILVAPAPSSQERYCAWYGTPAAGILYFGMSAFWAATRSSGDPTADPDLPGPQLLGRFHLAEERFLEPLPTGAPEARSGTWDVLAHPNGRVYFTTFFEAAGWVDPVTGAARRFDEAGLGLNELALGPQGQLLVSRYGAPGSVLVLDEEGRVLAEHLLPGGPDHDAAAKSVAWDPVREEIWVNTDLLPRHGGPIGHDARVLDVSSGRELRRVARPEVQFVAFAADGAGYLAERDGRRLSLRVRRAGLADPPERGGRQLLLDDAFPASSDFVQDVVPLDDGGALVTRWSGRLHRIDPLGRVRSVTLPRFDGQGLFYTAVLADGRVCATLCDRVEVVCATAP